MASARVGPDEVLQSTRGKTSYAKLTRLLICGGTFILRELFDSMKSSPSGLGPFLTTPHVKKRLKQMKKTKLLTRPQWKCLFPTNTTYGKSESFDITLIFKLLREFCIATPPRKGWDELPDDSDLTLPADLARIKYYRNSMYAHVNAKMELTDCEFEDLWKRIKDALLRIVKHYSTSGSDVLKWEEAIEKLLTDPLTEEAQEYEDELEEWYQQDQDVKKMMLDMKKEIIRELRCQPDIKSSHFSPVNIRCAWKMATVLAWVGGSSYLIYRYKDDPTELINMVTKVALPMGVVVSAIVAGSTILQVKALTVDALDELKKRYESGQLEEDLQRLFLTKEIRNQAKGRDIEIRAHIKEEELRNARDELCRTEPQASSNAEPYKVYVDFVSFDGDIFEDGENRFQAHLVVITSKDQVEQVLAELKKKDPDVADATHNIWAYRIFDAEKNAYFENCDDDGDDTSGRRVLRFLQRPGATNVMVIASCWYETIADDLGPVRFKYIQKSVLDLILASGIVEIQQTKIKKYFEEIKYTPFEKVKEKETPKFEILHGQPIEDRKSTFQGHLADITSRQQVDQVLAELKKDRKIAKAKYNMWACRIYDEKKKSYLEEGNDGGENQGAERLLHLLRRGDAKNVVVIVTRWHGGIHLGNDRFRHINKCAVDLLQLSGNIKSKGCNTAKPRAATPKIKRKCYH